MNSQPSNNYMPSYGVATKLHNDSATSASSLSKKSTTNKKNATTSLSGSETDVSTSTENLSQEERYVIKHTARQEPQGQEKQEPTDGLTHHSGRQLSLDNASSYNTLIIHATGEDGLDPWASLSPSRLSSLRDSYISATSSHSKASFPSSSASSSPTLASTTQGQTREINEIPDDYLSQSHILKHLAKEMKVVAPDMKEDYETNPPRRLLLLDLSAETHSRITGHRYSTPIYASAPIDVQGKLALSRSQPDLTQIEVAKVVQERTSNSMHRQNVKNKSGTLKTEVDWPASEMIQLLVKENSSLKTELEMCYKKVAKSQKLEEEVTNIHRSHQELMQSSERREKLERAARQRLQEDNRMLRQQYELLLAQMESPLSGGTASNSTEEILILKREIGKRDTMLAQLMAQNKELTGCRERQDIELAAQRATLQEQRTHIDILDTALTNAQANVMRLEEECRKRQLYEERVVQLQQNLSSLQLARDKLEGEMNDLRLSRRANNATAQGGMLSSDKKIDPNGQSLEVQELLLKIRERDERLVALENEVTRWQQWYLEENAMRQVVIDAASIPKDAKIAALEKTSQESERLMAEARTDKIRQLDELHAAQRRLANVEGRSRELESKLAEKEAMIKVLQQQHHSIASSGSVLSRASPHLHHSSSSSFHRQPSPSPMSSIMLSSLAGKSSPLTSDLGAAVTSSTTTLSSLPRGLCNIRSSSLGFQRSSSVVADYGTSSGPPSTTSSSSPMISNPTKNATASSSLSRSYNEDTRSLDEQLQGLDSQLLSGGSIIGALQQEKKDYPNHYWWV
ncbi:angiomotin-like isoform X2 [Neocloeon triangulifer]|uniref:angiomotin-like isoform X2 n=1 Tax=Neocloeon triangulifer TaxID=2078957 RepID=UPI00286F79C8|nr:angiomotin-like isoform X2 [Neocloeon triangulifer]